MKSKEQLLETIAYLKSTHSDTFTVDEEAIVLDYTKQQQNNQSLIIKILIIIGGLLTCLLITGFLLLFGLYDSAVGMIILGLIAIGIASYLSTFPHEIFLDTFLLSTYCVGYCLLGAGLFTNDLTIIPVLSIFILISAVTLFITRNYIISFISLLLVFGSFYFIIKELNIPYAQAIYTSLIAVLCTYMLLKEVKFLRTEKKFIPLYEPTKIAVLLTFIFLLSVDKYGVMFAYIDPEQWALYYNIPPLTSIVIFALFIYVLSILCKTLDIKDKKQQILLYIGSIIVLLPTCYEPTISGSLLIMFTCFLVNYKTGFVFGVLAFLYFIIAFYYDMNVSLLSKSISLIVSGLLFFGIYFLTSKKLAIDEKK